MVAALVGAGARLREEIALRPMISTPSWPPRARALPVAKSAMVCSISASHLARRVGMIGDLMADGATMCS
jgi:hypothetical protein